MAERLELVEEVAGLAVAVDSAGVVVGAQVMEAGGGIGEQVPDDHQDRAGDGDQGLALADAPDQAAVALAEEGVGLGGGGNGILRGNTVIAPYNKNNLAAGFLAPKYDISGGGTSEIRYDSSSIANGMTAVSNFVLGVAEK